MPVALIIGLSIFDPPLSSPFGSWYIQSPFTILQLPPIPANGVLALSGPLPGTPPGPYTIYLQAMVSLQLTNLSVMNVL